MSDNRCLDCMNRNHEKCDGIEYVLDMDGHSRYMCGCYCNSERVQEPCRHCDGQGFRWVTSQTKNRYRAEKTDMTATFHIGDAIEVMGV